MSRDQIWQEIKNDKSEIYGQSVMDLFLQLTDHLDEEHFFELNQSQIDKLNPQTIVDLLYRSTEIQKVSDLLGRKGFNKLDNNMVEYLVNGSHGIGEKHDRRVKENAIAILKYKDITESDIYNIISPEKDADNLEKKLTMVGKENLNKLGSSSMANLLSKFLNKFGTFGADEGFKMFKILIERLGENINKLESRHLSWTGSGMGVKAKEIIPDAKSKSNDYLEEILDLLGPKNLDKLTGGQINILLDTDDLEYRKRLGKVLGERLDKLSDKVVSAMIFGPFDNNLDLFNAADVADSLGTNRMSKWLKSNEAKETIDLMKEKVEKTKRNAHDWEDNFNAFMKWIRENIR